jgi:hypothetical protein
MCANCKCSAACPCDGGSTLARCACEQGMICPVCGHEAAANVAADPELVVEIVDPPVED